MTIRTISTKDYKDHLGRLPRFVLARPPRLPTPPGLKKKFVPPPPSSSTLLSSLFPLYLLLFTLFLPSVSNYLLFTCTSSFFLFNHLFSTSFNFLPSLPLFFSTQNSSWDSNYRCSDLWTLTAVLTPRPPEPWLLSILNLPTILLYLTLLQKLLFFYPQKTYSISSGFEPPTFCTLLVCLSPRPSQH
jgi:hypothetical protein